MEFIEQGVVHFRTTVEDVAPAFHGSSVREKRPDAGHPAYYPPNNLFLIYITLKNNKLNVKHMYASLIGNVDTAEGDLFDLAKGSSTTTAHVGSNFRNLAWRHPCYVTVVLDLVDWDFYWGNAIGDDPFTFQEYKSDGSGPYAPNYSFYNATRKTVRGCHAVRCINYLKGDEGGTDLDDPSDIRIYSIDLNLLTPFSDPNDRPIKVIIDPDGQNQGPPA